jgi:hypothetical protein
MPWRQNGYNTNHTPRFILEVRIRLRGDTSLTVLTARIRLGLNVLRQEDIDFGIYVTCEAGGSAYWLNIPVAGPEKRDGLSKSKTILPFANCVGTKKDMIDLAMAE